MKGIHALIEVLMRFDGLGERLVRKSDEQCLFSDMNARASRLNARVNVSKMGRRFYLR